MILLSVLKASERASLGGPMIIALYISVCCVKGGLAFQSVKSYLKCEWLYLFWCSGVRDHQRGEDVDRPVYLYTASPQNSCGPST